MAEERKKRSGWTREEETEETEERKSAGEEREEEIGACKLAVKARSLNSLRSTLIAAQKFRSLPSRFARVIAASVAITALDNDVVR